ncbi:unnamed protein product [Linum trigynum]|uniref:Auxin response factor n=1 Tax=Linum trigynum TaxID=586398 RepID=A0AAV2FC48_9ROSI
MEQLQVSMQDEGLEDDQVTQLDLPSKILCKVVYVCRMVEPETDEVYAQIDLLLEPDQPNDELTSDDTLPPEPPAGCEVQSFSKILTLCEVDSHGGDLHGSEWHFCHIYRGQPRRHLISTGWSEFARSKILVAGDSFIFLRGESGEILVGVRRHMRQQPNMPPCIVSSQNMHVGILATASHAIATGTPFSVFYKPRTSRFEFIVRVNKYLKARNHNLSIRTRVNMRFDCEKDPKQSFNGTIVGVGENFSSQWYSSEWRSFKVKWDELGAILLPDRVSFMEVEPIVATTPSNTRPTNWTNKRSRPSYLPSLNPDLKALGILKKPIEPCSHEHLDSCGSLYNSLLQKCRLTQLPSLPSFAVTTKSSISWPKQLKGVVESISPVVKIISSDRKHDSENGFKLFGIQLVNSFNREESSPCLGFSDS